jgi:hypothetical protein
MVTVGSATAYVDLPDFYTLDDGSQYLDEDDDRYWWYG